MPRTSHATAAAEIAPELLTEAQAAALFGVSSRKFLSLRDEGWMPKPIMLGPRALRWLRSELMEALTTRATRMDRLQEPAQLRRAKIERMKAGAHAAPNHADAEVA